MQRDGNRMIVEEGKQELFVISEFDAPRELVFKAYTDQKLRAQWLGPRNLSTNIERQEAWTGGSYRFIQAEPGGRLHGFHGVYHEVQAPDRIIDTFEYEGLPEKGHVSLETTRFESLPGGRTRVTAQAVFQSVADRDGMVGSGMEQGVRESRERLNELLEKLKQERPKR